MFIMGIWPIMPFIIGIMFGMPIIGIMFIIGFMGMPIMLFIGIVFIIGIPWLVGIAFIMVMRASYGRGRQRQGMLPGQKMFTDTIPLFARRSVSLVG